MKYFLPFLLVTAACMHAVEHTPPAQPLAQVLPADTVPLHRQLVDTVFCDGFDFPLAGKNGWTVRSVAAGRFGLSQAGERWKSRGGPATGKQQPVYAVASGEVLFADSIPRSGNRVYIGHRCVQNGSIVNVYSEYRLLGRLYVKQGDRVSRRQLIAETGDHADSTGLAFSLETGSSVEAPNTPSAFIGAHRSLTPPCKYPKLVIIDKSDFKCYLYEKGNLAGTYEIALGQVPVGAKEKQGDLKVPEGEYRICEKSKGPFSTAANWSAAYLGTRWMCLTYPNTFDAQRGLQAGLITPEQFRRIKQATEAGIKPPQNTKLGGGIGLHGWIESDWSNTSDRAQTWGCVSFHNRELEAFYDRVSIGTVVIIIP